MSRESITQATENTAYQYNANHSSRTYSKEFQTLFWALHNGGIHAKNAIKTIGGIAKLDVEDAHKVYKTLSLAGLSLPVIITTMTTAPASVLLAVLGGSIAGLIGRVGETKANHALAARHSQQRVQHTEKQFQGRIALLEQREATLKQKTQTRFEAGLSIIERRYAAQLEQKDRTIYQLRQKNLRLIHDKEHAVQSITEAANEKISTGIRLRDQALEKARTAQNQLTHADQLCQHQAQEIFKLKDRLIDYDIVCQELEAYEHHAQPVSSTPSTAQETKIKRLKKAKKSLSKKLIKAKARVLMLREDVIASKNQTIEAQQHEIATLKFVMECALMAGKADSGTTQGADDSRRYTAICEGVSKGYLTDLSFTALKKFKYAGSGAGQNMVKKYREALIRDGLASIKNGELNPIRH